MLLTDRLPSISKDLLSEEFGARQHLLSCINMAVAAEAMAKQFESDDVQSHGCFALAKLSLQPLWTAFCVFATKKLALRRAALKGCQKENTLVTKLFRSTPFTPSLFDPEVVELVVSQADHQAKPVLSLLGFRPQAAKRSASSSGSRRKRRRGDSQHRSRGGQSSGPQSGQRTPDRRRRSPSPSRGKSPGTPARGSQKSPRGRGKGGPRTPKRGGHQGQNF